MHLVSAAAVEAPLTLLVHHSRVGRPAVRVGPPLDARDGRRRPCFRRASWTLLVAAPEARRGPTPDAVRAERGVTRLPLLEPRGSPSRGGRVPDGRVPIGQFDRPRMQ